MGSRPGYQWEWMKRRQASAPLTICECGCGAEIPSITLNGKPRRFVKGHHNRVQPQRRGPSSARWKGGEAIGKNGYARVTISYEEAKGYPTAVVASQFGRHIARSHLVWNRAHPDDVVQKGEHIHHINHVRDDDRIENLEKMNGREHARLHGHKAI